MLFLSLCVAGSGDEAAPIALCGSASGVTLLARLKRLSWGKSLALLVLTLLTLAPAATQTTPYLEEIFTYSLDNGVINHVVVHEETGKVYVGAVNTIYQLTETLGVEKEIRTGPEEDSPNCPAQDPCTCSSANCEMFERRPTNAINKALLIDYKNERLIACFNIFQGHCERRHLKDIADQDEHLFKPMVPTDADSPAVLLIAPGPRGEDVLYVGATRSTVGMVVYRDLIPAVCSRDLDSWELAEKTISSRTEKKNRGATSRHLPDPLQIGLQLGRLHLLPHGTEGFRRDREHRIRD